jgi:hypothetical protein
MRRWQLASAAFGMLMPEAAVNKDYLAATSEDDVWAPGQVVAMKTKPIA